MNFGILILKQSINKMLNYARWIQIALSFILELKIFIKTLQKMLKLDLIHQIMKSLRPLSTEKNKNVIRLMKDELIGKIMTEFIALRPNTYSYIIDDDNSDKKLKEQKNV